MASEVFHDDLQGDLEHEVLQFLQISEVCALQRVSKSTHVRLGKLLVNIPWDVIHCAGVDKEEAHLWLMHLCDANVKLRRVTLEDIQGVLLKSVRSRLLQVVEILAAQNGVDVNKGEPACLHRAIENDDMKMVECLLSLTNIDVNVEDDIGRTPLQRAVSRGNVEIVKLLLTSKDIDANGANSNDATPPLHAAVKRDLVEVIKLLLTSDVIDVNAQDTHGRTPLSHAVVFRYVETVKFLLTSKKIDVNVADSNGRTPLHHAAFFAYVEIVELLLTSKDIDVDATDKNGRAPLHYAVTSDDDEVVKLLSTFKGIDASQGSRDR